MKNIVLRIDSSVYEEMSHVSFRRYPDQEYGTFFKISYSDTGDGLYINAYSLIEPCEGEIPEESALTVITPNYQERVIQIMMDSDLGVGFIHTHPEDFFPCPSELDNDLDRVMSSIFDGFCPEAPYISMILSKRSNGELLFSGRVYYKGEWYQVGSLNIVGKKFKKVINFNLPEKKRPELLIKTQERLGQSIGEQNTASLWSMTVAIIGSGGIGKPTIETLARAGYGKIIIIDYDHFSLSNYERDIAIFWDDLLKNDEILKVESAKQLIHKINPHIEVVAIKGNVVHPKVVRSLLASDVILNCSDSMTTRLLCLDMAFRFLIPVFQINVEVAKMSHLSVFHFYYPGTNCSICRNDIDFSKVSFENISKQEQKARLLEEKKALEKDKNMNQYYTGQVPILTVGSLTKMASAQICNWLNYYITGQDIDLPDYQSMDYLKRGHDICDMDFEPNSKCNYCSKSVALSDQGQLYQPYSPPEHIIQDHPEFL